MGRKRLKKAFHENNTRRHALIDKKYDGGLTTAETQELAELTSWVSDEMDRVYPIDFSVLDRLEESVAALAEQPKDFP